jgi:hypothetical protein
MNRRTILFAILLLSPILTFSQSEVKKMLKDINGQVDEIVIKSEGKEFTFSGDEAEELFSALKKDKQVKSFSFTTKDGKVFTDDSLTKKIIIKNLDDDSEDEVLVFVDEDFDSDDADIKKIEKKVVISDDSGKKIVKVTTNEDGKENIEVYEGKAADDYLEKMKSENEIEVKVDVKEEDGKKIKKIIIEKEAEKE